MLFLSLAPRVERRERFKNFTAAFENAASMAKQRSVEVEFGKIRLPRFQLPEDAGAEYGVKLKQRQAGRI
jgi:DNA polymerase III alpha subunit